MSIYSLNNQLLSEAFSITEEINTAYDVSNQIVFSSQELPIPTGNLTASQTIPLTDLYEEGKGFTCTGLAYDATTDTFLVGDIGILLPNSGTIQSQIVRLSSDFQTVEGTIPVYGFSGMSDVQGITIDTSDNTIWFCCPSAGKIYHTNANGENLGSINATTPTGIAYSAETDSFWVLNYNNKILRINKTGITMESYDFAYSEQLDQCFLDEGRGYLYIVAGANYTGRNNVYLFNTETHEQSITCTVDSYSVEGIWIGSDRMVIVNDGYYHSATLQQNVANIYLLE